MAPENGAASQRAEHGPFRSVASRSACSWCDRYHTLLVGGQDMLTNSRLMTNGAWLSIALIVALSCKQGPSPETQARIDSLSQASSQKDRLGAEVAETPRFVSEISADLAKAAVPPKKLKVS